MERPSEAPRNWDKMDIKAFELPLCPSTVIYIPNFITLHQETAILNQVQSAPKPKWQQLSNRRLLNYGGVPHPKGMIAETMPSWLNTYVDVLNNLEIFDSKNANHVLVNEYLPGQGIMPHFDGPLFYPTISTISCGSHTVLEFQEHSESEEDEETPRRQHPTKKFSLLVERRSLLILKDDLYTRYQHNISEPDTDIVMS